MELSFYTNFANDLAQQESYLNTLQQEVSTGESVTTSAQNPTAFETATLGTDQINALTSETSTQASITSQLGSVSNTYQSVSTLLDSVQSVIEQALNATTSTSNMSALATEVTSSMQELVGLGNATGGNGSYLFSGSRGSIAPFQTNSSGNIVYMGDGGQSLAAISPDTTAATLANGESFMSGLTGSGFGSASAATANTGSGLLVSQGVTNPAAASAFQSGGAAITLSFAEGTSGMTYTATQGGTTLSTGAVTSGMSISLGGSDYKLSGTPAAGDSFTVAPSQPQSAFALLQSVAATLGSAGSSSASSAQTDQQLNEDLGTLLGYQQSVLTSQAQTGVTLQAVTAAGTSDAAAETSASTLVQAAVGVNMPAAITALDDTLASVQAAMKAFSSVESLSLFNYL
jgi:flagellar hook-associated protein 3 FlgL